MKSGLKTISFVYEAFFLDKQISLSYWANQISEKTNGIIILNME